MISNSSARTSFSERVFVSDGPEGTERDTHDPLAVSLTNRGSLVKKCVRANSLCRFFQHSPRLLSPFSRPLRSAFLCLTSLAMSFSIRCYQGVDMNESGWRFGESFATGGIVIWCRMAGPCNRQNLLGRPSRESGRMALLQGSIWQSLFSAIFGGERVSVARTRAPLRKFLTKAAGAPFQESPAGRG